ncbi:hypothetical protein [Rhizosphaericola mali]|uniref:Uncharacterized protein n=1 Tax=Rhizosphaericola mali TaxID=2545455 RepID=A0A5P2G836_9BACT|nr:hypothetical protein [Rhizosphaericola mali]QES90858.1 hypothetical protein E0W69_020140 [Rhizosphaericola mali]
MLENIIGGIIVLIGALALIFWIYIASSFLKKGPIERNIGLIGPMVGVLAVVAFRYIYERYDNAIVFYVGIILLIALFYFIFTSRYTIKNQMITKILNILALFGLLVFIFFVIRAGYYKIFMK